MPLSPLIFIISHVFGNSLNKIHIWYIWLWLYHEIYKSLSDINSKDTFTISVPVALEYCTMPLVDSTSCQFVYYFCNNGLLWMLLTWRSLKPAVFVRRDFLALQVSNSSLHWFNPVFHTRSYCLWSHRVAMNARLHWLKNYWCCSQWQLHAGYMFTIRRLHKRTCIAVSQYCWDDDVKPTAKPIHVLCYVKEAAAQEIAQNGVTFREKWTWWPVRKLVVSVTCVFQTAVIIGLLCLKLWHLRAVTIRNWRHVVWC